jgi:hypothetical protein
MMKGFTYGMGSRKMGPGAMSANGWGQSPVPEELSMIRAVLGKMER